ncbi:MAG: HAD family hydrolase, partial [Verrucomicrobiota bacterium]
KIYLKHRFEGIELFDDVVPTLDRLKGKYKLGLLSNGNSYPEKCGLDGVFDFAVFAQDCGFEKPDSRIFEFALLKAGCASNEILHVGDSLRNDIEGARSASMASVWLNRDGENNSTNYIPNFEIETLSQLPEIVGRLNLSYRLCK